MSEANIQEINNPTQFLINTLPLNQLPSGGQLSFPNPDLTSPLFSFSQDLLGLIVQHLAPLDVLGAISQFNPPPNTTISAGHMEDPLLEFLSTFINQDPLKEFLCTCKAAYNALKPFLKWIQPQDLIQQLVGCYHFTPHQHKYGFLTSTESFTIYTANFKLHANGTMEGTGHYKVYHDRDHKDVKTSFVGEWTLSADCGSVRVIPRVTDGPDFFSSHDYLSTIRFRGYQVDPADFEIDSPETPFFYQTLEIYCGIPLQEQGEGVACCTEIVEELVNSIWDPADVRLNCELKSQIISKVSKACVAPPGMTNQELQIRIANEIAEAHQSCFLES